MVDLLFSWRFIEILRYKQTACINPLTENCVCTFDTTRHGSDQSIPHSIGFLKDKFGVHTLALLQKESPGGVLLIRCSEIFRKNLQENTCAEFSFLIKLQA